MRPEDWREAGGIDCILGRSVRHSLPCLRAVAEPECSEIRAHVDAHDVPSKQGKTSKDAPDPRRKSTRIVLVIPSILPRHIFAARGQLPASAVLSGYLQRSVELHNF